MRILLVLLFFVPGLAWASIYGQVVGISDGDTVVVLTPAKEQLRVRLAEIDTPERRQPYGSRARQALAAKVFRKTVRLEIQDIDRYGRSIGRLYLDGRDINAEMVAEGHAWVYRQYARDPRLPELEAEARRQRLGLWALPEFERTPPWDWRRAQRAPRHQRSALTADWSCENKRYCRQMSSCEEARYHLLVCGVTSLDGDGDGTACESLCR